MNQIREQALLLGPRKSLVGIIAVSPSPLPDAPMVVILNSGIIHRVGAHRVYVPLSRALAAAGFPVLRFDLSGIGDSENRVDMLSPFEASLADIRKYSFFGIGPSGAPVRAAGAVFGRRSCHRLHRKG